MKNGLIGIAALLYFLLMPNFTIAQSRIVPEQGYQWPEIKRNYWPTDGWLSDPIKNHDITIEKVNYADSIAESDNALRSL